MGIDDVTCNRIGHRLQDTDGSARPAAAKPAAELHPPPPLVRDLRVSERPWSSGLPPSRKNPPRSALRIFYVHCATSSLVPVLELPGFTHVAGDLTCSAPREVTVRQKEGSGTCSYTLLSACRASSATSPTCWGRGWGAHRCHTRCGAHSGCRQPRNKSSLRCSGRSAPSSLPPLRQRKMK